MTDVLGTSIGDGNHTTTYGYNNRGQVTTITPPSDPFANGRRPINNFYNADGNT